MSRQSDSEAPERDGEAGGRATTRVPRTPVERWREIVETSHDGVAIVDADGVIRFTSPRFAERYGVQPDDMLGILVEDLVPELDGHMAPVRPGRRRQVEHNMVAADEQRRTHLLTWIPRNAPAEGAIVLQHDITRIRAAERERQRAQHRLTEVEEQERRHISRGLHDQPVQLLAALALRLGAIAHTSAEGDQVLQLRKSVETAAIELREILAELEPDDAYDPATVLPRWCAPLLSGSAMRLEVDDRTAQPPNRQTAEALFFVLYEILLVAVARPVERQLTARVRHVGGGYELEVVLEQAERYSASIPRVAAGIDYMHRYARSLGGTFSLWWEEPDIRIATFRIPTLDEEGFPLAHRHVPAVAVMPTDDPRRAGLTTVAPTDDDWRRMATASDEGVMELDRDLRVASVNAAYTDAMKRPAAELLGLHISEIFTAEDYARLEPYVLKVRRGEAIRFDWQRLNAAGEPRWTEVSAAPRVDAEGRFAGALLVTLDTTDVHLAESRRDASLAHLRSMREGIDEWIAQRLDDGPLYRLEEVLQRLDAMIGPDRDPGRALVQIHDALGRSVEDLRVSTRLLQHVSVGTESCIDIIRQSVAALLVASSAVVRFHDASSTRPPDEIRAPLVRVGREAVANAILHSGGSQVDVRFSDANDGWALEIVDDGVGIDPRDIDPRSGHLGIRSMREGAAEAGGVLTIGRATEGGSVVRVEVSNR